MNAKDFIELYEVYRDYKTEMSLLDEDYRGFKNYYDWKKHTDPARAAELKSRNIARTKAKAASNFEQLDPETRAAKAAVRLKRALPKILKDHGLVDPSAYYDEKKQIAQITPEILNNNPEAKSAILDVIANSGLDAETGMKVFYDLLATYADRKKANALYSKNRQEHREPDDPDDREFKQSKRESLAKQRESEIEELKNETDMAEFSQRLYDLIVTHDLKKTRPMLKTLKSQLAEDDPKQKFIDIALNKSLQVKYRKHNLEDFHDQEETTEEAE